LSFLVFYTKEFSADEYFLGLLLSPIGFLFGLRLFRFGSRNISLIKNCTEKIYDQIRVNNFIDAKALSIEFQASEIDIRKIINRAKRKQLVPRDVDVK
tara:strand:+ start:177 stop:470 length:294 start_codon:yes stop_codon:yes gene_type:complete